MEPDKTLALEVAGIIKVEKDYVANTANVASLVFHAFREAETTRNQCNWCGFYFLRGKELVLGPFHGKPACIRIRVGRGVCGTAVSTGKTQFVEDVHQFPGHIACDAASRSEIVVPVRNQQGDIVGVFDLDNVLERGFSKEDCALVEFIAELVGQACDWSPTEETW